MAALANKLEKYSFEDSQPIVKIIIEIIKRIKLLHRGLSMGGFVLIN